MRFLISLLIAVFQLFHIDDSNAENKISLEDDFKEGVIELVSSNTKFSSTRTIITFSSEGLKKLVYESDIIASKLNISRKPDGIIVNYKTSKIFFIKDNRYTEITISDFNALRESQPEMLQRLPGVDMSYQTLDSSFVLDKNESLPFHGIQASLTSYKKFVWSSNIMKEIETVHLPKIVSHDLSKKIIYQNIPDTITGFPVQITMRTYLLKGEQRTNKYLEKLEALLAKGTQYLNIAFEAKNQLVTATNKIPPDSLNEPTHLKKESFDIFVTNLKNVHVKSHRHHHDWDWD